MKIVFLGDSLTWGGYGGNFVDVVAKELADHTIINEGIGGDTVVNLNRRLESIIETHEPDAMFVMVGGNDASSYSMPETRNYYRSSKKLENGIVSPDLFESTYRDLLTSLQLNHILTFIGLAPTEYNASLIESKKEFNRRAKEAAESFNIPILDLETPFTPKQVVEREPVNLKFIQEIGVRTTSAWKDYEAERQKYGYTYTFDGMHLMPAAAEKMGKLIADFLKKHL